MGTVEENINLEETIFQEVKSRFQYEVNRFQEIENKNHVFLVMNTILFSYIGINQLENNFLYLFPLTALFFGMYYSFRNYNLKEYKFPKENLFFVKKDYKTNLNSLLHFQRVYKNAVDEHHKLNNLKIEEVKIVILMSKISWISFLIIFLIQFVLNFNLNI